MNLSINYSYNNPTFNAKNPRFTMEYMDKILNPLLLDEDVTIEQMATLSHYKPHRIHNWFLKSKGISAAKFFKLRKQEKLKQQMADLYEKNPKTRKLAEFYDYSVGWVNKKLQNFNIRESREELNERLSKTVPPMLKEGRSVEYIAADQNCSPFVISSWINKNIKESVREYRRNNNIRLKKDFTEEELELKQKMENAFAEGDGIKDAAKHLGITRNKAIYWKERFGLKTKKEEALEKMKEIVPVLVPLGISLKRIAKEIGEISAATVRRFIKDQYGKTYIDIRMGR